MVTGASSGAVSLPAFQLPEGIAGMVEMHGRGKALVTQGGAHRTLVFAAGRIRQVASGLESERLGAWLVARGVVDRRTIESASANGGEDERLGNALIRLRAISEADLANELRVRAAAIAARMLFEAGAVEIESGDAIPEGPGSIDLAPLDLFVAGARRAADAGKLEAALGGDARWVAATVLSPRAARIELGGLEKFVVTQLHAPRSLAELRKAAPDQRVELLRALAVLVIAGIAAPAPAAGPGLAGAGDRERAGVRHPVLPAASPRIRERLAAVDPPPAAPPLQPAAAPPPAPLTDEQLGAAAAGRREAFELLRAGGDPRAAYRLLTRAVDVAPDPEALLAMARIELANPLWRQRALDHLKSALGRNPRLTAAWLELANYWSLRGEPEKQRRCLQSVLKYDPGNAEVRDALALVRGGGA
jgi:tetratricopeptide (TPR) repeat protein